MSLLIIELVLCIVFALILYQCCAKRASAMGDDADDLETFRQRMGAAREGNIEEDTSPEAIAARKELIHKNLFSRKIKREDSVKELSQLLAISRGRAIETTNENVDEEMGGCAPSCDTTDTAVEGSFSSEADAGDDVPTPSAPPLTQTDNIATALHTPNDPQTQTTTATAESTTAPVNETIGESIRNLWKGITHPEHESHPQSRQESTTPQCQHKLECSICLDEYSPNDTISWAKDGGDAPSASLALTNNSGNSTSGGCDHIFHQECIVSWLEHHDDCPLCRRKLVHQDAGIRFSGAGWEIGQ
jgi:hypothetical protein